MATTCIKGFKDRNDCRYNPNLGCDCGFFQATAIRRLLEEVEAKINQGYIGGMTEYWNRRREVLLKELQAAQMREWNL